MAKKIRKQRVPRTRNAGTMTESMFWSMIRATLRNKTMYWKPRAQCLKNSSRPSQNKNKRLKWEFLCNNCKNWYAKKDVEAHHSSEAGSLKSSADLQNFVEKLFSEDGWICLCKTCHKKEHK